MEKLTIDEIIGHCERKTEQHERLFGKERLETMPLTSSAIKEYWEHRQVAEYLKKLKDYEDLEERLNKIYGDCDGLLESIVELLEKHSGVDIPDDTVKVLLITNESVDFYKKCKSLEEQGRLIKLPCKDVYFIVDINNPRYAAVTKRPIRELAIYEIESIDKKTASIFPQKKKLRQN